ncbi:ubiquitin-like protein 4A [Haliotis rufescens]|uniref:ubiquitin-like protein 4A n=1 Tax=Haliotis rufescens TaxID=6454 RepID=UPI001EB06870|nr:ubiquitin-like protein 4A [Haliotis rufescens]XP_046357730.1 ubiquitin-like protein 4A [Haliotis rufescens]
MRLTVKVLNGDECTIAASPSSYVTDIKQQVAALMSIPIANQKLLYKGKPMTDNKQLSEYNIEDGSKLTVVSRPGSASSADSVSKTVSSDTDVSAPVWTKLQTFLRRHYTEKDADLVLAEFRKDFNKGLASMSLDDIERLAASKIRGTGER